MKEALRKAIEGGWKPRGVSMGISNNGWSSFESMISLVQWQEITSDPLFWQALGKQQGWYEHSEMEYELPLEKKERQKFENNLEENVGVLMRYEGNKVIVSPYKKGLHWKEVWHLFIDHLAEGKDADEFFKELLK